jgi:hypothetical protein
MIDVRNVETTGTIKEEYEYYVRCRLLFPVLRSMVEDWEALQDEMVIIMESQGIYGLIIEMSRPTRAEISKHREVCKLLVNYIQAGDPTLEVLLDDDLVEEAESFASTLMVDRLERLLQKNI